MNLNHLWSIARIHAIDLSELGYCLLSRLVAILKAGHSYARMACQEIHLRIQDMDIDGGNSKVELIALWVRQHLSHQNMPLLALYDIPIFESPYCFELRHDTIQIICPFLAFWWRR